MTIKNKATKKLNQLALIPLALTAFLASSCQANINRSEHPLPSVEASMPATETVADSLTVLAPGTNIGMWVWRREEVTDANKRKHLLEFCQKFGINRIFVQVRMDEFNGRFQMATPEDWSQLLADANAAGIAVDALDEDGDMGFASQRAKTMARLNAVLEFQKSQPANAKFAGVHYDIEPYVTARWKNEDKHQVAVELLETMVEIRELIKESDSNLSITHDIPFWYSGRDEYLIEFNSSRKYLNEHIQDLSDFVGIMSYRTKMTGGNSVSDISKEELAYAQQNGSAVYLSLETVPLKATPTITFHEREPIDLVTAIRELSSHQKGAPGYGGINLHTYRTARPMLEQWEASMAQ